MTESARLAETLKFFLSFSKCFPLAAEYKYIYIFMSNTHS